MRLRSWGSRQMTFVATALAFPIVAIAQSALLIDFGDGMATRAGLQLGYQAFEEPGESTPSPMTLDFASSLGNSGTVSVSVYVTPTGASLGWRDREGLTGGPFAANSELLSDFVLAFSYYDAQTLNLQLTSLLAGHYRIKTYHHDSSFNDHGEINVYLDDASGLTTIATNVRQTTGHSPSDVASLQFEFTADGTNPVMIRFDQVQGNAAVLNGFDLTPSAPIAVEPRTWSLMKRLFKN